MNSEVLTLSLDPLLTQSSTCRGCQRTLRFRVWRAEARSVKTTGRKTAVLSLNTQVYEAAIMEDVSLATAEVQNRSGSLEGKEDEMC